MKKWILLMVIGASFLHAQQQNAAQIEAMAKLSSIAGEWIGDGWMVFGERKNTFTGHETIRFSLSSTILVIEGLHKTMIPNKGEMVVHEALGIISYEPATKKYMFRSYIARGNYQESELKLLGDSHYQWDLAMPTGPTRFIINLSDPTTWIETGEFQKDGKWSQFFEMKLIKK